MSFKVKTVDIRRSENTTIRVVIPEWELPLLQAMHGLIGVSVIGESVSNAETPEVQDEFKRLTDRYGSELREDGSRGMPICEAVYGQFQPGLMNLQRSIEAATLS